MSVKSVQGFGSSHKGGRSDNEDWFLMDRRLGLYIVADGMGGRVGGEVASRLAAEVVHSFFEAAGADSDLGFESASSASKTLAEARMDMALRLAHREVTRRQRGALEGMGSTLVVFLFRYGRALLGSVGDSRIYRYRRDELRQLTVDHSFHSELLAAGVSDIPDKAHYKFGNLITRAVGMRGPFEPDVTSLEVGADDQFLLCSDGLTDAVDEATIETILRDLPASQIPPMLVATALSAGVRDNVTALIVRPSDK